MGHGILRSIPCALAAFLLAPTIAWPCSAHQAPPTKPSAEAPDFSAALAGLMFDPATLDGNGGPGGLPNGLLDAAEMALVAAVLACAPEAAADAGRPQPEDSKACAEQSAREELNRKVAAAWQQALSSATQDLEALSTSFPTAAEAVAGYAMIGTPQSLESIGAMTAAFGAPLHGDYSLAADLGDFLGPDGDADGDGATNRQEYLAARSRAASDGRAPATSDWIATYVERALDPQQRDAETSPQTELAPAARLKLGVVLFPGFEVLDVYGPLEMWGYVPEFEILTIAEKAGPVSSSHGVETVADWSFGNAPALDVLLVPGGGGTFVAMQSPKMLDFLRRSHANAQLTTSVCTGSMLLAAAGILDGRLATSNKLHFHKALEVSDRVRWIEKARWVDDGDVITSSGVSAGIDMALHIVARLFGRPRAEDLARWTEYTWNSDPNDDPFVSSIHEHSGHSGHDDASSHSASSGRAGL